MSVTGKVVALCQGVTRSVLETVGLTANGVVVTAAPAIQSITAGTGAPTALVALDSGKRINNTGTTVKAAFTLPTAAAGLHFYVDNVDSDGIRVNANTGDTIRLVDTTSAAAGYVESVRTGSSLHLVAVDDTTWHCDMPVGTWGVDSAAATQVTAAGGRTLTFATAGDTITASSGDWAADGYRVGRLILVAGTSSNNGYKMLVGVTATVLTVSDNLVNEGALSSTATINSPASAGFAYTPQPLTAYTLAHSWDADVDVSENANTTYYTRSGNYITFTGEIRFTGAPPNTTLTINIPGGFLVSGTYDTINGWPVMGEATVYDNGVGTLSTQRIQTTPSDRTTVYLTSGSTTLANSSATVPVTFATGDAIWFRVTIPVN